MIKSIKPTILFLILVLLAQRTNGQVHVNMTDYLSQKFLNYTALVPREEIYVHSDRDEYISGEDLWFNVFLIDRKTFRPSSVSKIAYFELLNPENRPVVQRRVWLTEGFGPGQIVLPDTLSTGTYTIRAYTSWMRNFLPYNCFVKDIHIYNSFTTRKFKGKAGSGSNVNTSTITRPNPSFKDRGLTLKTDNLKPDVLELIVTTDEKYRSGNNNQFFLFIQTHGIINRVSSETVSGEITRISVPRSLLTPGINQITVFDSKGVPVGERYTYTSESEKPAVSILVDDSSSVRKKISIDLAFGQGSTDTMISAGFSVSVVPLTKRHSITDLDDYLIFGTEFGNEAVKKIGKNKVENTSPEVLDSLLQNVSSNWINWNNILTDVEPAYKYRIENEYHYIYGKLLKDDQRTGAPDEFVVLSIPGKIPVFQYAKTDTEGNFNFRIHIDDKIKDLIIQPDNRAGNNYSAVASSFSDQYLRSEMSVDSTITVIPSYISSWSVNHQVRKIYTISSFGNKSSFSITFPVIKRFYGRPAIELMMKDYITLPVMQEVFFELLTGAYLKNKKSGFEITVNDPLNNTAYDTPPGLFIDGVMIKDASVIAAMDPELVEEIDVVRERYFVGDYLFYGIVNIITKAGDFSNVSLPANAIRLPYTVIDPVVSFVSPDYSTPQTKNSRIPDFRNTLYWNPSVKPGTDGNAKLEFWSSDFVSEFEIIIQGISPEENYFQSGK